MASLLTSCHMPATCITCQQKEKSLEFAMVLEGGPVSNDYQTAGFSLAGGNLAGFYVLNVFASDLGDKGRWQLCFLCLSRNQLPEKNTSEDVASWTKI